MSSNDTYVPSMYVTYGYMGTKYSYILSQLLLEYLPRYIGYEGYVDVSALESAESSQTIGMNMEYGITVACIPVCLFILGFIAMLSMCVTSCCQRANKCCKCCQCFPKATKKRASKNKKRVGPLPRSAELERLFGLEDPRTIAMLSREAAQEEKLSISVKRQKVKRYLLTVGATMLASLLPTLYAYLALDTAIDEMQGAAASFQSTITDVEAVGSLLVRRGEAMEAQIGYLNEELYCNSTRVSDFVPYIDEFASNQAFITDLTGTLGETLDAAQAYLDGDVGGLYRQLLLGGLFVYPLLVLYFMFFNTYKREGAHCLGGLCINGKEGVNQSLGMAMAAFYVMLFVYTPFLITGLALADLCHSSSPVSVLNEQVSMNVSGSADPGMSIDLYNVTKYYSTCNGSNPLSPFLYQARNSTSMLQEQISSVLKWNETEYWAPPSCTDNSCVTCPTTARLFIMHNITVKMFEEVDAMESALGCVGIRDVYKGLVEDTLCGDLYEGTAALGLSQLLASFALFLCMWLLLLVRQHYEWMDQRREDADYDSDHEGFEKWNMKGHDESSDEEEEGEGEGGGVNADGDDQSVSTLDTMEMVAALFDKSKDKTDGNMDPILEEGKEEEKEEEYDTDAKAMDDLGSMMSQELGLDPGAHSIFDLDDDDMNMGGGGGGGGIDPYFNPNAAPAWVQHRPRTEPMPGRRKAVQYTLEVGGRYGVNQSILDYDLELATVNKPRSVEELVHFDAINEAGYEDDD